MDVRARLTTPPCSGSTFDCDRAHEREKGTADSFAVPFFAQNGAAILANPRYATALPFSVTARKLPAERATPRSHCLHPQSRDRRLLQDSPASPAGRL